MKRDTSPTVEFCRTYIRGAYWAKLRENERNLILNIVKRAHVAHKSASWILGYLSYSFPNSLVYPTSFDRRHFSDGRTHARIAHDLFSRLVWTSDGIAPLLDASNEYTQKLLMVADDGVILGYVSQARAYMAKMFGAIVAELATEETE